MKQDLAIIPGTDGYLASSDGRIFRPCKGGWTEMGYSTDRDGHLSVKVRVDGTPFRLRVHRLVLEAFVGPRPEDCVGCHITDRKWDNSIGNLMWAPQSVNVEQMYMNAASRRDIVANGAKLNEYKVVAIKHALAQGLTHKKIGEHYGVNARTIRKIAVGETWKHVEVGVRPKVHEDHTAWAEMPVTIEYDPIPEISCPCSVV